MIQFQRVIEDFVGRPDSFFLSGDNFLENDFGGESMRGPKGKILRGRKGQGGFNHTKSCFTAELKGNF